MAIPTRTSSSLGRRSVLARIAAVLALVAAGIAIYFVVMAFTDGNGKNGSKNKGKGRSEQALKQDPATQPPTYTVVGGDTLSGIAERTDVPAPRIERLNPDLDSETLNAGQVLTLR
ncbi:MAG: LysM peptidoglycan-binding domain-containing protein [Actinomycetota bacterium]|nr:LysM peptidoglycan-binding domain-containing protein [Actinomycetota bacterium]